MAPAPGNPNNDTEAWLRTAIAEFPKNEMYTTCGILDDDARAPVGIVSSTHVKDGRISSPRTSEHGEWDPYLYSRRATLKKGDLAVVLVRRTGDTALVTAEHEGWTATRSIGIIRADPLTVRWLRIWLQTPTAKARIDEDVTAHVEPTVSLDTLRRMPFPLPPPDTITKYHRAFNLIEETIDLHQEAARKAVELADAIHNDWTSEHSARSTRLLGEVAKAKTGTGSARTLPLRTEEPGVDAVTPTDLFDLMAPHVERFRLGSPADTPQAWPPGTLMLSSRPDGAHMAVTRRPATPTRGVVAVGATDEMDTRWLLHELRSRSGEVARLAQGRNAREISARALLRLSITWPDANTRADFHAVADPLHAVARQLISKVATLHDLKDALLHDISARTRDVLEQEAESSDEDVDATHSPTFPAQGEVTADHESGWPLDDRYPS